jgi:hypothetical protein
MGLSPSREAASRSATQEHPTILWNLKIHYSVHKRPPLIPILSQKNPVHASPSYISKIHFDIIFPLHICLLSVQTVQKLITSLCLL